MKKILFLMLMAVMLSAFVPLPSSAQAAVDLISTSNGLSRDTVTNAGVKTLISPAVGYTQTVTIQVDVTKISGTLGGTIVPVASNDGTNFYAITGSYTVTDVASQGTLLSVSNGYRYYGARWTGTGTMSGSFAAKLVTRKP